MTDLQCPFCGGRSRRIHDTVVVCLTDGCDGAADVNTWNKRKMSPEVQDLVEWLEAFREDGYKYIGVAKNPAMMDKAIAAVKRHYGEV